MPSKFLQLLLFCVFACFQAKAQQSSWEDFVQEILDDEQGDRADWAEHLEELNYLHNHPLDINLATEDDLRQLPMLNEEQIEEIATYLFLHNGMRSLAELMAIKSIDAKTRRMLSLFLYVGQEKQMRQDTLTLRKILQHTRHEVDSRTDLPLYYRRGYTTAPNKGGYVGQPISHRLRYRMQEKKHLDFALKMEKDAGESMQAHGYDFYSAFLRLHDIGKMQTLVVGDYRLGFAQGLVMNKAYGFGKTADNRISNGIKGHTGMDEDNFLRGLATTWAWQRIMLSAWASFRQADATLDTAQNIRTLLTGGIHRTRNELRRRNNTDIWHLGGRMQWRIMKWLSMGATGYWQRFSRPLNPGTQLYRTFYPQGQSFGVVGVDYSFRLPWLSIAGEAAYSANRKGLATLHSASWRINTESVLSLCGRYYAPEYYSFHASALSDGGAVQNESGFMLRYETAIWRKVSFITYLDAFHAPWPRYGMTHSSTGAEFSLTTNYAISKQNSLSLRYQLKSKEMRDKREVHHRMRLRFTSQLLPTLRLQTQLSTHQVAKQWGYAVSQSLRHQSHDKQWTEQLMLTYYNTQDYNSRIYISEPHLTNSTFGTMLYGRGLRLASTAYVRLWNDHLRLEICYAVNRLLKANSQGSGMEEIHGPWRNDISLGAKVKW